MDRNGIFAFVAGIIVGQPVITEFGMVDSPAKGEISIVQWIVPNVVWDRTGIFIRSSGFVCDFFISDKRENGNGGVRFDNDGS